jgi:CDP-diacylglycerol--serine O-phosphatidyltransferase
VAVLGVLWLVVVIAGKKPPQILFLLFFCYALSGPVVALWRRIRRPTAAA